MPASKKTIHEVLRILNDWRAKNRLSYDDIVDLLIELEKVSGNKSFTETIKMIRNCW